MLPFSTVTEQSGFSKKEEMRIAFRLARSGETEQARVILARTLKEDPNDPQAWAVMSEVVETHQQAIDCLYRVLKFSGDLAVVRWATDQLELHKAALRGTGALDPNTLRNATNEPPTPPFGTPVLPFATERQPTPPPMSRPDFLHNTPTGIDDIFDTGVEEIIADQAEVAEPNSAEETESDDDKATSKKQSSFSFLKLEDDPITQTLESPFKQTPLPESDWLEWDDQTIVLDTRSPGKPAEPTQPLPTAEPDTGKLPTLEPATDSFPAPKAPRKLSDERVVKSFATGNQELIPGFETPVVTDAAQPNLSFDFDDEPQSKATTPSETKRRSGCLRAALVTTSIILLAVIVGGFFLMINGLVPTPAPIAALPFMTVAETILETEPTAETGETPEPAEANPTIEIVQPVDTLEPTPTVTPTAGPEQATTNLPLLEFEPELRASLSDVEENPAAINAISNTNTGRVALASRRGVYVFEEGGAPFIFNELGAEQVALSPVNEDLLVSNDGVDLVVWDAGTTEAIARLTAHNAPVTALQFSPNGDYLFSGSEDGTIIIWDAEDLSRNRIVQRFNPTGTPIELAGWGGDSERYFLISESPDADVSLLGVYEVVPETGDGGQPLTPNGLIRVVEVPLDITSIAISGTRPRGTQVSYGTVEGTIQVVNIDTGSVRTLFTEPNIAIDSGGSDDGNLPPEAVVDVDFSTTGLLAAAFGDGTIALWSGETFEPVGAVDPTVEPIDTIRWQPDGRTLLFTSEADVFGYSFQALQITPPTSLVSIGPGSLEPGLLFELEGPEDPLAAHYSPNNRFVSLGLPNNRIIQYSVAPDAETAGTSILQTQGPLLGSLEDVAFSPDGRLIAAALANGTIVVWSIEAGEVVTTLTGLGEAVTEVTFSNSGILIAAGAIDGDAAIWDIEPRAGLEAPDETLNPSILLEDGHRDVFSAIEWSPDDSLLATGSSDDSVTLWDTVGGTIIRKLRGHELGVGAVTFSSDGRRLASSVVATSDIFIWDMTTLEQIETLEGHLDIPVALSFRPGSATLLSAGSNGSGFLWQYQTSEYVVLSANGRRPPATDADFAPNGRGFIVTYEDGSATVYSLDVIE